MLAANYTNGFVNTFENVFTRQIKKPYISFKAPENVTSINFCPYEDVLGIGYFRGFDSIIIPGSGSSSIDSYENNPFRTKKQRDNFQVSRLLDKIPASMITLDNNELKRVRPNKSVKFDSDSDDENVGGDDNKNIKADQADDNTAFYGGNDSDSTSSLDNDPRTNFQKVLSEPIKLKNKTKGRNRTGKKMLRKKQIIAEKVRKLENEN